MGINVKPIDILVNTGPTYDPTRTSYIGKITQKTLAGRTVVGSPIVKYRNSVTGPEAVVPAEIVITQNDRIFVCTLENLGIITIAAYNLQTSNGDINYIGRINIVVPEPPSTTYAIRGFRVVDDGTSNWKIFLLVTANVPAHAGLYMVNDVTLADFVSVPPTFPTANAPGQKAVYKLDNVPNDLLNGTGLVLDKDNSFAYVHRGVAATHSYICYDYSNAIVTVGALGATSDLFGYETGNLPPLAGVLLLTNSEEFFTPTTGPNAGFPCVIFHTTTLMYQGRLDQLLPAVGAWPSLDFRNNLANLGQVTGVTTVRASYSESLQRVILLAGSSALAPSVIVKEFANDQADLVCTITANDNNEITAKEMYKFKLPIAPTGFDSRQGYISMVTSSAGVRGIYTAAFDTDDTYDLTHIISPVLDVRNEIVLRLTAGFVRPDLASPVKVYYRTSGFSVATGGWIAVNDDLDFGSVLSPTGQMQIKIGFKVFENESTNGIQLYSAGLVTFNQTFNSDNWEYSHDDSSPGNPSIVALRLKATYNAAVPTLFFRAFDLSDSLIVNHNTIANADRFQYSTDGGVNWLALGTIPNTVGTLVRYTFAVSPGVDVRPSLREF